VKYFTAVLRVPVTIRSLKDSREWDSISPGGNIITLYSLCVCVGYVVPTVRHHYFQYRL